MCVRDHSYACEYTRGLGTPTTESRQHFDSEKLIFFLCSGRGSNLCLWNPLDLEADALPMEPPRHPVTMVTASNGLALVLCSTGTVEGIAHFRLANGRVVEVNATL